MTIMLILMMTSAVSFQPSTVIVLESFPKWGQNRKSHIGNDVNWNSCPTLYFSHIMALNAHCFLSNLLNILNVLQKSTWLVKNPNYVYSGNLTATMCSSGWWWWSSSYTTLDIMLMSIIHAIDPQNEQNNYTLKFPTWLLFHTSLSECFT